MSSERVTLDDFGTVRDLTIGAELAGVDLDALLGFAEGLFAASSS